MNRCFRTLIAATLVVATGAATADPYHHGRWDHGRPRGETRVSGWGALALGLAIAVPLIALAHHADRAPEPAPMPPPPLPPEPLPAPVYVTPVPPPPVPSSLTPPVIYPRWGQTAEQTEFDQRECNRWAATQPTALADASVFRRAVDACMDGRGYTLR